MRSFICVQILADEGQIFEQSQFASELGAAVHLAPNSNGILKRLGIRAEDFGSNPMKVVSLEHP